MVKFVQWDPRELENLGLINKPSTAV